MKKVSIATMTAMILMTATSVSASCTVEQGMYSSGYSVGTEARNNPQSEQMYDYARIRGACTGKAEAYESAKSMNPRANKISVEAAYQNCIEGAKAGYEDKKPGKKYKESCENYTVNLGN